MSAVISCILKFTVGVLFNKLRKEATNKLLEGDLTDEKCRQLIVRELDDIKSKLDALIRKDLLSSVEFFRDGMNYLEMAIQSSEQPIPLHAAHAQIPPQGASSLDIDIAKPGMLVIASEDRFRKAKEKFKTAGEEATRAFSNPALSTEDKILATKLRVSCSILEGVEDIQAAVKAAVMYLERLHDLPAVQEAFSVHLNGGLKSVFNKTKRLEIVQAVSVINFELFDFSRMFVKTRIDLFDWPKIQDYQPVLRDPSIPLGEFGITAEGPFYTAFTSVKVIPQSSTINSKGDVIAQVANATIFIFFAKPVSTSTRHAKFCSFPEEDQQTPGFAINTMATDGDDNLYVIISIAVKKKGKIDHVMYTFDSTGVLKHQCQLFFMNSHWVFYDRVCISVNKLGQIVMNTVDDKHLYVFDSNGQLQRKFCQERAEVLSTVYVTTSDTNEIIAAQFDQNKVYVYTAEGKYNRIFQPPKEHTVAGVAFNHVTKSIILLTNNSGCMYLLSYGPDTDKPQMLHLDNVRAHLCNLTSHVNSLVALITNNGVIII